MSDVPSMLVEEIFVDSSDAPVAIEAPGIDEGLSVADKCPILVGNINLHINILIVHSSKAGVASKRFIIPSINKPLSEEEKAEIIQRERQKMEEEASGEGVALAVIDPSGGAGLVVTDPSGELVE
jgi:hypothetical protein